MPKSVLVIGGDTYLGGLLAARLAHGDDRILCWAKDACLAPEAAPPRGLDGVDRLDDIWIIGPTQGFSAPAADAPGSEALDRLHGALRGRPVGVVHFVGSAYAAGAMTGAVPEEILADPPAANNPDEVAERAAEREVAAWCQRAGFPLRIFRTSMLVGGALGAGEHPAGSIQAFLRTLLDFEALLDNKSADYLRHNALHLASVPGAGPNVLPVEAALDWMIRIARSPRPASGVFHVTAPEGVPLERWARCLASLTGLKLESSGATRRPASPVDSLLRAYTAAFACYLTQPKVFDAARAVEAAGEGFVRPVFDEKDEAALVARVASAWTAAREVASQSAARSVETLEPRSIACDDGGGPLEYRIGGRGPVVVCINAMGQGITVWTRLLARLLERHRVVYYSPRGTYGQLARPFTLTDQEIELERILDTEGIRECRIVAWCTGAKVGLELVKRRPTIAPAMVLLAGAFKPLSGLSKLETPFEGKVLGMCQMVNRQPEMASLVKGFMDAMFLNESTEDEEGNVLGRVNRDLRSTFIQPFCDVQSTRNYSRQVVDYMTYDIAAALKQVAIPVLFIGGELDQIASPGMSRAVSRRLPVGRYVEIRGGTHYSLFENADLVAGVIERFFESPRSAPVEAVAPSSGGTTSARSNAATLPA